MKRRTIVEYDDAAPSVQAVYDEIMKVTGSTAVPNVFKALGNNDNVLLAAWSDLRYCVIEGGLPPLLKQLILFTISVKAKNDYCTALHGNLAMDLDKALSCDELYGLTQGQTFDRLPRSFKVAIDVVSLVALDPGTVAAEDFDFENRLRDEGFSESEIDELLGVTAFSVMMNTIASTFDIPPERPFPPLEA